MIIKKKISNVFLTFLIFHLLVWTLVPTFSNINLPLDTIEALAWGSNLDWGFQKHPPLSAFMVESFYNIFGKKDWAYYLLSQIFIIIAFISVFKFSEDFFNNRNLALISVLLLEGIYFYNYTSPEFNVNVCQIPFWTLSILFTWRCIKYDKFIDYFLLGLFTGLGILSKYLFIYLAIGIKLLFIYLIYKKRKFKIYHYFIAGFVALLILSPHLNWLLENNFSTISYALQRTGGMGSFVDHFLFPIIFISKQILVLVPFFIMCFFLIKKFKFNLNFKDEKIVFLFFTVLMPIILVFFTSMILGSKIRTMWMTPFYLFFGTTIIYIFKKDIVFKNLNKFYFSFLFFLLFSPLTYLIVSLSDDFKRTDYPGKEIARLVENKWDNNFRNEIKIVVGDEWFAGNLSYHLVSRPKWLKTLESKALNIKATDGVIYTGNPKILKQICPGVYGTINPVGFCMIGQK